MNPDLIPIIKEKNGTDDAFTKVETEIIKQPEIKTDCEKRIITVWQYRGLSAKFNLSTSINLCTFVEYL